MEANELYDRIKDCRVKSNKDDNGLSGALSKRTILIMTPDSELLEPLSVVWDEDNNAFIVATEWLDEE